MARNGTYRHVQDKLYEETIARDGEQCGICGKTPREMAFASKPLFGARYQRKWLVLDHDHANGGVRGILCWRCNVGLGYFGDSLEGIEKLLAYLKKARDAVA